MAYIQGSLQPVGHGNPPSPFEIPPNKNGTKFIGFLSTIFTKIWSVPKTF